jgi:hypothetical protein
MEESVEPLSESNWIIAVGACNPSVADEPFDLARAQYDH